MGYPEATFTYPGISNFNEVRYTMSHGISPGRITVRGTLEDITPRTEGTAVFRYAGTAIQIPGCRVDSLQLETGGDGKTMIRAEIFDQRWRWRFGHISGEYNRRRRGGDENDPIAIEPDTKKTPQDLARLCLEAMGERRYDVSKMPNVSRPYVNWDYKLPAVALSELVDACGCRVVLKHGGQVSIEQAGVGAGLQINQAAISGEAVYDPPELPAALKFAAAPSKYQYDFRLEPMAIQPNGDVVSYVEADYIPPSGWETEPVLEMPNVEKKYRDLAKSCIWKVYRIMAGFQLNGEPKTPENVIESIEEILLLNEQLEVDEFPGGLKERRLPWVYGQYDDGASTLPPPPRNKVPNPNLNKEPKTLYRRGFTVDTERGLVIFSEPVHQWQFDKALNTNIAIPPVIRLRAAFHRRDIMTRGLIRFEHMRGKPARVKDTQVITRNDIGREAYVLYQPSGGEKLITNETEVKKQAEYYLDAAQKELEAKQPGSLTYDGFAAIQPDGAIQQVTWSIGSDGRGATTASRNQELENADMSYREKQFIQRTVEGIKQDRLAAQKEKP
ncbi:hypothetical protein [Blastopirellula retiformator]|uniref:Uncharacterized protein n=1 Tax=Blastopirellula retiformator TaxID=2527970 RepID=A0A5C5UZ19_9BACT|nr:hypothetical protein [Blastopirellula retiformator]TWT30725.1 hypothetical protein Enr8_42480 [Blastopirellula retiformator]